MGDRLRRAFDRARGVRGRITLVATLAVMAALALGGFLLAIFLEDQLEDDLDATLEAEAASMVRELDGGIDPLQVASAPSSESLVWIGTLSGGGQQTLAAAGEYQINPPFEAPPIGDTATIRVLVTENELDSDDGQEQETSDFRVAAAAAADGTVVIVGEEQEAISQPVARLCETSCSSPSRCSAWASPCSRGSWPVGHWPRSNASALEPRPSRARHSTIGCQCPTATTR